MERELLSVCLGLCGSFSSMQPPVFLQILRKFPLLTLLMLTSLLECWQVLPLQFCLGTEFPQSLIFGLE